MDLGNFKANKETVITIKHPVTGAVFYCDDGKEDKKTKEIIFSDPATWTLISKHTAEYKRLAAGFADKMRELFGEKKLSELSDEEVDQLEMLTAELTARSTTDFNVFVGGEKLAFSQEKAKEILCDESYFWLKDQVVIGANDVENFILA